jgi:hypothetical protein
VLGRSEVRRHRLQGDTQVANGTNTGFDAYVLLGFVVVVVIIIAGAYGLEAVGECVRHNVAAINSTEIGIYLEHRPLTYRLLVSGAAGLILWAGLRLFSLLFHKLQLTWLEPIAIVAGLFLASYIPPSFPGELCQ